jgi:putative restriction endonuclease
VIVNAGGCFEVGRRLKADFDSGRHYYELHGVQARSPRNKAALPSTTALSWHRENRYLG